MSRSIPLLLLATVVLLPACGPPVSLETAATTSPPTQPTEAPVADTPTPTPTELPQPTSTPTAPAFPPPPLLVQSGADLNNRVVSVDPGDPGRLAYCAPDEIRISADAGATWTSIPVSGAAEAAAALGYPLFPLDGSQPPQCFSVTLDASHPASIFAVFATAKEEFGAPPLFYMGFYTTDGGGAWMSAPFPEGASLETFGGFYSAGAGAVQALYNAVNAPPGAGNVLPVLQTADGGASWSPGSLTCPAVNPCLRWGPAAMAIPGMGSPLPQYALSSPDGGQTWMNLEPPAELRVSPPNQLVAFPEGIAMRVSGSIGFAADGGNPVSLTLDGGQSWEAYPLPPLPEADPDIPVYPGLQVLPDGAFLSQGAADASWYLLPPGAQEWCPLENPDLPTFPVELPAAGGNLWWVDPEGYSLRSVPLADLVCP